MNYRLLLILFLSFQNLFGQSVSFTVDSLTHKYIHELSKKDQKKFEDLLKLRIESDLLTRIDTLQYDYAFITENICLSKNKSMITESYFSNDSTLVYKVVDHSFANIVYSSSTKYFFQTLSEEYSRLYSNQILAVKPQYSTFSRNLKKAKREKTRELKSTFQIQTKIDKTKNQIVISIQLPPEDPEFEMRFRRFYCQRFLRETMTFFE